MSITRFGAATRMSQMVVYNGLAFSAGQVGKGEDITAQTKDALANLDQWLAKAGTDKSKILSATIWIANVDDFAAMNAVWDGWIDPKNPPARACTEAKLALPEFLFEVMVIAAL